MRLSSRRIAAAVLVFAGSQAAGTAAAGELALLGAKIDLPFEHRVLEREQALKSEYGLSADDEIEIEITSGPLQGQRMLVDANYWTPSRIDTARLQKAIDEERAEDAKRPGTHVSESVVVDGHALQYIAQRNESPVIEWPEHIGVQGLISGSTYSVRLHAKDAATLTPAVVEALKGMALDYESLVRARGRFDEEAQAAVQGTKLVTPIGTVEIAKGMEARFRGSTVRTDADGKPMWQERFFEATKIGFWGGRAVEGLGFACAIDREDGWREVSSFYDEDTTKPVEQRTVHVGGEAPVQFLGKTGLFVRGKGPMNALGVRWSLDRTLLRQDGTIYMFTATRDGNGPIGEKVGKQLRDAATRCGIEAQVTARK